MVIVGQLARGEHPGKMIWLQYQNRAVDIWGEEYVQKLQDPIKPWVSLATCSERWGQGRGCPGWRGWSPPSARSPAPPQGSTQTSWQGRTWWSWYQRWLSRFYGKIVVGVGCGEYGCREQYILLKVWDEMCQMKLDSHYWPTISNHLHILGFLPVIYVKLVLLQETLTGRIFCLHLIRWVNVKSWWWVLDKSSPSYKQFCATDPAHELVKFPPLFPHCPVDSQSQLLWSQFHKLFHMSKMWNLNASADEKSWLWWCKRWYGWYRSGSPAHNIW